MKSFDFSTSVYQNISNVVNLQCEECHEKLEQFLESLSIRHKNDHNETTIPVDKSAQTEPITILELKSKSTLIAKKNDTNCEHDLDSMIEPIVPETDSNLEHIETLHIKLENSPSVEKVNLEAKPDCDLTTSTHMELPDYSEFLPPKNTQTEKRANRIVNSFKEFIEKEFQNTFEELVVNQGKLEEQLIHFIHNYRVNDNELPKKSTIEQMRSFIKIEILKSTDNKFDIADLVQFPRFCKFYKGYMKKLKIEGKGEKVSISTPIPNADLAKINQFLVYLHSVMNGTTSDLSRIPQGYEQKYHSLVQKGLIFILFSFYPRKSSTYSSIQNGELKVDDFEITNHPVLGQCYKKIDDDQTFIPFRENKYGLNYGQYMKDYISVLNPNSSWLLTQPHRSANVFVGRIWYEGTKLGKNTVANTMSDLSQALELPRYINAQISVIKIDVSEFEEEDPLATPPAEKKIKIEIEDPLYSL